MQQERRAVRGMGGWAALRHSVGMGWVAIWGLLCLPWLSGLRSIPYDAVQQFFPAVSFTAGRLRELQAPWWNPYLFGGYPQLADPQMMTFQPTMVLPMLLAPTSLHWFGVVVMLHVLAGGFGALQLARHYRLQAPAQLLFTVVMMFGGVAASRLQHTPMIVSYCLLPWLWLGLSRLRHRQQWQDVLLAGIAGGLCALQLTQLTYLIILGCAGYAVAALLLAGRRRGLLAGQFAVVGMLAAAISAPQWVSTLAYLGWTNRSQLTLEMAAAGALHWQSLATLVSGGVFSQGRGHSWAFGDITTDYLYYGAIALALWLAWGAAVVRAQPQRARLALLLLVVAVIFALGAATPLFPWLFGWLPGLDLFRRPSDALFLTVPAAAWLAAHALQAALDERRLQPHWPSLAVVAALLAQAAWLALQQGQPQALLWVSISVALGAAAVYMLRRPVAATGWLIGLLVADLLLFNIATGFNALKLSRQQISSPRSGPAHAGYRLLAGARSDGIPERAAVFGIDLLTNGAAVYRLPLVNGYNPLLDATYRSMTGMPESPGGRLQDKPLTAWTADMQAPLYDLLGVRWVLAAAPFEGSRTLDRGVQVLERASVLPRVLNPRQVRRHDGPLPPAQAFNATDFSTTLWLSRRADGGGCEAAAGGMAEVRVNDYDASRLTLQVRATAPAWVVINEVNAPGWEARVGDVPVPLLQANGLFRAVCVPAGTHQLELRYRPWQLWRAGLAERAG